MSGFQKILCIALFIPAMGAIWFFLRWFIPAYGDAGFVLWMIGIFIAVRLLEPNGRAAEHADSGLDALPRQLLTSAEHLEEISRDAGSRRVR